MGSSRKLVWLNAVGVFAAFLQKFLWLYAERAANADWLVQECNFSRITKIAAISSYSLPDPYQSLL